ncbi:MAG: gliding motility-associated protein GldM [Maribacter sp.]|jgi:gliding motility-associated protein GldM
MSLPKEPRQLMITLMYLVLLAMLAMNVSAEIMNAFLTLDKGIGNSNNIVDSSNMQLMNSISKQADAYKEYSKYKVQAESAREISKELNEEVTVIKSELFALAGGPGPENPDRPVRFKDKDIPSKLLIDEGKGEALRERIIQTREKLLALIEDEGEREALAISLPLQVPEKPENSDKKTWSESAFYQMPVVAVMPMFTKMSNDIKTSETAILNHFFEKAKGTKIIMDEFEVVASADKGYIIRGEEYNAEIFLGAYSSSNNNISVSINGKTYPVRNGKASYKINTNGSGTKEYEAVISVRNPLTNEVKRYKRKFKYEVGERSVTVSADRMNVLYIGVENPISVSAAGVPTDKLNVKAEGTSLQKVSGNKFMAKPTRPGKARIIVSGGGLNPTTFEYRVKRIPDPTLKLGNKKGGRISKAEFKAHKGPIPFLDQFEFDAKCKIDGFELVRLNKNNEARVSKNKGGRYDSGTQALVKQADHGDTYFFNEMKVRCPGDISGRNLNGMIFNIE